MRWGYVVGDPNVMQMAFPFDGGGMDQPLGHHQLNKIRIRKLAQGYFMENELRKWDDKNVTFHNPCATRIMERIEGWVSPGRTHIPLPHSIRLSWKVK